MRLCPIHHTVVFCAPLKKTHPLQDDDDDDDASRGETSVCGTINPRAIMHARSAQPMHAQIYCTHACFVSQAASVRYLTYWIHPPNIPQHTYETRLLVCWVLNACASSHNHRLGRRRRLQQSHLNDTTMSNCVLPRAAEDTLSVAGFYEHMRAHNMLIVLQSGHSEENTDARTNART